MSSPISSQVEIIYHPQHLTSSHVKPLTAVGMVSLTLLVAGLLGTFPNHIACLPCGAGAISIEMVILIVMLAKRDDEMEKMESYVDEAIRNKEEWLKKEQPVALSPAYNAFLDGKADVYGVLFCENGRKTIHLYQEGHLFIELEQNQYIPSPHLLSAA